MSNLESDQDRNLVLRPAEVLHMMLGMSSAADLEDIHRADEDPWFAAFHQRFEGEAREEIGKAREEIKGVFNLD